MSKASIIGAYNTKFGAFVVRDRETKQITDAGPSLYDLIIEAGKGAIADAGLNAKDIDAVYFGACSPSMFVNQEHLAPLGVMISKDLRFKPMTRCEAACASSSVALYDAVYAIEAGRYKNVLVIGVEKMNELDTKGVTHALACSSYWPTEGAKGMTFPALFAEYAKGYQKQYKISDADLAKMLATVSALCYKNALENPLAHFGKGGIPDKLGLMTADAILALDDKKNPMIAPPLRLHDCSLVTDGAAALVVSASNALPKGAKAVEIAGIGHAEEIMEETARAQM
ncbi:MAG: propanoyl-CoA acyltransferase, partial [Spirochaetae bacterium HGW-Spirochaetae-6]